MFRRGLFPLYFDDADDTGNGTGQEPGQQEASTTTDPASNGAAAGEPRGEQPRSKPPWGSDEDFDPNRAWQLIQNLRGDLEKSKADKAERDELREKVKQYEDASKSDRERLEDRASTAEQRASRAEQEAARLRVALRKGLTETQAKRLVGETEEELEKDAEELLESFASGDKKDEDGDAKRRPKERLKPGSVPDADPEPDDPAALAQRVSRGGF